MRIVLSMLCKSIDLAKKLNLRWPSIIQAPMAGGITTPQLVAAVSNSGGLGSFATGYLTTVQVEKNIKEIKSLTPNPFAVNVFIPNKIEKNIAQIKSYNRILNRFRSQLGMPEENDIDALFPKEDDNFYEIIDILAQENIGIVSFTFGNLPAPIIQSFKRKGIYLMGTATSLEEARILSESGIDAIIAQGYEAGGHRGGFLSNTSAIGTMVLISQLVNGIKQPIIAAGGIMDGHGIMASLSLGASAIQMGTAFLTTKESGANKHYTAELIKAKNKPYDATILTSAYSGKEARALKTAFISHIESNTSISIPPYPITHALTKAMRKKAVEENATGIMSMWAGQGINLITKDLMAKDLVNKLREEVDQSLKDRLNL